jgi:squalene cyclase
MSYLTVMMALLAAGTEPEARPLAGDEMRQSVQQGLHFLETEGMGWQANRKCAACHHVPMLLWSHHDAQRKGFALNPKVLAEVEPKALEPFLRNPRNKAKGDGSYAEDKNTPDPELVYLLASAGTDWALPPEAIPGLERCINLLLEDQETDGSWSLKHWSAPKGAPIYETDEVYTLWVLLALRTAEKTTLPKETVGKSRERAMAWLHKTPPGETAQSRALRLVIELQLGKTENVQTMVKNLLSQQRPDGGWSWGKNGDSDALGTGLALYALSSAGVTAEDRAVQQARSFLIKKQEKNGRWGMGGSNKSFFTTGWAVVGLMSSLPSK